MINETKAKSNGVCNVAARVNRKNGMTRPPPLCVCSRRWKITRHDKKIAQRRKERSAHLPSRCIRRWKGKTQGGVNGD